MDKGKSASPISVSDISKLRNNRLKREYMCYKQVLDGVYKRIHQCEKLNYNDCLYRVPPIIIGMPLYSREYSVNYILNELINNGQFKAWYLGDSFIYISWGHWKDLQKKKKNFEIKKITETETQEPIGGVLETIKRRAEKLRREGSKK